MTLGQAQWMLTDGAMEAGGARPRLETHDSETVASQITLPVTETLASNNQNIKLGIPQPIY